jgi:hypothetical protein
MFLSKSHGEADTVVAPEQLQRKCGLKGPEADLDAALRFIVGRTEQQAVLSGNPLNEDQRLLLNYLPDSATLFGACRQSSVGLC